MHGNRRPRAHSIHALAGILLCLTACTPPLATTFPCNDDQDCRASERCIAGRCTPSPFSDPPASPREDGGIQTHDAGQNLDGGNVSDTGPDADSGPPTDASTAVDAGPANDAGPTTSDAGLDAGPLDCGPTMPSIGDGGCLPAPECSPGYAELYPDEDNDGVGAGAAPIPGCQPLPPPSGFSETNTDCAPGDDGAWRSVLLFLDNDGDGITAGNASSGTTRCIGATVPSGYQERWVAPPRISYGPARSESNSSGSWWGGGWSNREQIRFLDGSAATWGVDDSISEDLRVSDLGLELPDEAVVTGVRVRMFGRHDRRFFSAESDAVYDVTVRLAVNGAAIGVNRAQEGKWPFEDGERIYGGPHDLWGAPLTAAILNQVDFGLLLAFRAEGANIRLDRLELDNLVVEVFLDETEPDCSDSNPTVYANVVLERDNDDDHYGNGDLSSRCTGATPPSGFVQRSLDEDCYDNNPNARPGQTNYYTSDRGDGSFDYNCDGNLTKKQVSVVESCACNVDAGVCDIATTQNQTPSSSCGTNWTHDKACGGSCPASCDVVMGQTRVSCR